MHDEPAKALVDNVFRWMNLELTEETFGRLEVFADFLRGEASTAGGIGPTEGLRVWRRHICDSLTFLAGLSRPGRAAEMTSVVDIGSGVGLPGIPLAIAMPAVGFTLLDRSARRCLLARRAARILELDNVAVVETDAIRHSQQCDAVVSRASLPFERFVEVANRVALSPALGLVAGSHGKTAPDFAAGATIIEVPAEVLGSPVWLAKVSLSGRSAG